MIDYILSSGNPGIEPVYYKIAIGIVILLAFVTGYHCRRGRISKSQSMAVVLLVTYIFLVFASTVFSRPKQDYYSYELTLFWSYREIWADSQGLFWEDVLNVVLLLPIADLMQI